MAELTEAKGLAVAKTWGMVDKDLKGNGVKFFIALFEAHPDYKNMFQPLKDIPNEELVNHKKMKAHGAIFMNQLSSVLRNLDDLDCAGEIIKKIVISHKPRGLTADHFVNALKVFSTFLKTALGEAMDEETVEAWGTVIAVFLQIVEGEYS